jgi:hypothetical protein
MASKNFRSIANRELAELNEYAPHQWTPEGRRSGEDIRSLTSLPLILTELLLPFDPSCTAHCMLSMMNVLSMVLKLRLQM